MSDGYVKLWRKSIDSRVFKSDGLWKLWTYCLMRANHKHQWVELRTGKGIVEVEVQPGQFVFGRHSAAKDLNMNAETVRKRMDKLKKIGNITIQSTNQYSIITIINWDSYQSEIKNSTSKSTNQVPTKYQPSTTDKNEKNEKNKPRKKIDPPDFVSEEIWNAFVEHRKQIKAPLTDYAAKLIFNKLEKANAKGVDPEEMLKKSIESGWKGVFEPNANGGQRNQNRVRLPI